VKADNLLDLKPAHVKPHEVYSGPKLIKPTDNKRLNQQRWLSTAHGGRELNQPPISFEQVAGGPTKGFPSAALRMGPATTYSNDARSVDLTRRSIPSFDTIWVSP
jgi:hypothetical protein